MRRPLFGNGIPVNLPVGAAPLQILNAATFTPDAKQPQVLALTLFAWWWTGSNNPKLALSVGDAGAVGTNLVILDPTYFTALETTPGRGKPVKVLDRYLLRGNQQVTAANFGANSDVCFLYGYFEVAGDNAKSEPYRPLQPSALVAPFYADPTVLIEPTAGSLNKYVTAHQLSKDYVDVLTLNVNTLSKDGTEKAAVRLPGGVVLPLPSPTAGISTVCTPFEGIPMIAPSASDNLVEIGYIDSGTGVNVALSAYGSFRR